MALRIVHLIASQGFYDAERVATELCKVFARRGHDTTLVLMGRARPELLDVFRHACVPGVRIVWLECRGRLDFRAMRRLRSLLRWTKANLLHTHGYKADVYGYVAARMVGIPVIATCHNRTASGLALRLYRALDTRVLRAFDGKAAVTTDVAEQLAQAGIDRGQLPVIQNGVGARMSSASCRRGETRIIGALSRLSQEKGLDVLVRALPLIQREFPNVWCVLAGEGPERCRLRRLAIDLGVSDALCLPGFRPSQELLATCDVFALPSRSEGTPMGLLEAMAAGTPVVASAVGGVLEVLEHEYSGLLVPSEDPAALAQAIIRLLRDAPASQQMAAHARERVRTCFSTGTMAVRYTRLYNNVLARRPGLELVDHYPLEKVEGRP